MLDAIFNIIASLGPAALVNVLTTAGERFISELKDSQTMSNLLVDAGEFYSKFECNEDSLYQDLALALSKENLSQIAKDLQPDDGYGLKQKLYDSLMQLMGRYYIPYEVAENYSIRIIYAVLEQIKIVDPDKYEHYFLQEWRDEQEKSFCELRERLDKMSRELAEYKHEQIAILSSGQMDIELRRRTQNPSIGIEFFIVDDDRFRDEFEEKRYEEIVYIRGRNREEIIYCVLNELWRLNDKRPVYVITDIESWKKLSALGNTGNIYIPWFYADEIVAIENNTNIFVLNDNTPVFSGSVLELRPRLRETLSNCLQKAGMDSRGAYELISDTHGLYAQIKKRLFRGEYLKDPPWVTGISEKGKKTCLLIGSWEEIDGDKLIIEALYGDSYDRFIDEILPYTKCDDPLLYMINRNETVYYYLACAENIWSYLDVLSNETIWAQFIGAVFDVVNESEDLFIYDNQEALVAKLKGEKLFWSETIRKGMLKTLLIKGIYRKDEGSQQTLDGLITRILDCIQSEKQWKYISKFWRELCEISPDIILKRLESEFSADTGLISLFKNQSSDIFHGRNSYIDILWGVEQFLTQQDYFWPAFRWLLNLDSQNFEYKSNSTEDIFTKVFCTWMNFAFLQTAEEKLTAARIALEEDRINAWSYLFSAISDGGRSIFGELSYPKYRDHTVIRNTTVYEMQKTREGYLTLLVDHVDHSDERWIKIINYIGYMPDEKSSEVIDRLLSDINQIPDKGVMRIKNGIRHLLYRHRYFSSSDWALPEEKLLILENLLDKIAINTPEYEYSYLFVNKYEHPLMHPAPYKHEKEREINEAAAHELIRAKLKEFHDCGYDLSVLASACAQEKSSSLGLYLAEYWNNGNWDYSAFYSLLSAQESGEMAKDYLTGFNKKGSLQYSEILEKLAITGCSIDILATVYRLEAQQTKKTPLVTYASEEIKREFWKYTVFCDECNRTWALEECRKYALLDVYLDQIHMFHYNNPLTPEQIYNCFDGIENMPHSYGSDMMSYHLESLLSVIQDAYIDDPVKSIRISHLELFFMNILEWKSMKCFRRMIKQAPELYAQLIDGVFKKDHAIGGEQTHDKTYIQNMYTLYDKAQFCPAENDGIVNESSLEQWINKYHELLISNDQESLFTSTLGRLFAFSPLGFDGHEPCEAVRKMIEKYGDEQMISGYHVAVFNRRGVYSPSAGKEELRMAEAFKENARYLEPDYPVTAKIFNGLYETYKRESDRGRLEAENGW